MTFRDVTRWMSLRKSRASTKTNKLPDMSWMRITADDVAPTPWRNGGGRTRELLAWPHVADWKVRVSIADIDRDGPFSAFPGVSEVRHHGALPVGAPGESNFSPANKSGWKSIRMDGLTLNCRRPQSTARQRVSNAHQSFNKKREAARGRLGIAYKISYSSASLRSRASMCERTCGSVSRCASIFRTALITVV